MPLLFSVTLFLSAALLFSLELMFGRMILPKFGGSPAVWNTCMVFYQVVMLAGYSYAHWMPQWLGIRKQAGIHLALLLVPLISLPIAATRDPGEGSPVFWLLLLLCISVGLPFFMVSTSAPLLQKWFASTGHPSARDPYFLYAASNLGSMLALFAYPTLIEHVLELGLRAQSLCWTAGYVTLLGLTAACAFALRKAAEPKEDPRDRVGLDTQPPTIGRIARWVALACVPSSMMLGVTTYLSTDISPMPMIWVLPLGLYLLSFILVFSRLPREIHTVLAYALPILILVQASLMLAEASRVVQIPLHLATLFCVCMVCHGQLAQDRPDPQYLTAYYLWLSVGGAFGGMFNALVAPVIFKTSAEYPLAMALACLLMPRLSFGNLLDGRWKQAVLPLILGMLGAALIFRMPMELLAINKLDIQTGQRLGSAQDYFYVGVILLIHAVMFGIAVWICLKHLRARTESPFFFAWFLGFAFLGIMVGGLVQMAGLVAAEADDPLIGLQVLKWWMEYPLAMLFVCLLLPETGWEKRRGLTYLLHVVVASFFGLLVAQHIVLLRTHQDVAQGVNWMAQLLQRSLRVPLTWQNLSTFLQFALPLLLCGAWVARPVRFGLGVAAILLASAFYNLHYDDNVILRDRSFFGVMRVERWAFGDGDARVDYNRLMHGTTLHGRQELDADRKPKHDAEPQTYYHRTGPIGQVFAMLDAGPENRTRPIGAIGLGIGTVACYAHPGQEFSFYEIDDKVKSIAEDQAYFSNLADARRRGARVDIVLGDARLSMSKAADHHYRLIIVDAFSSDAIPVHLMTLEALELYLQKLAPDGIIAFHISNRYLDLEPVLSSLSRKAQLKCLVQHDSKGDHPGKAASTWVIMARADDHKKAFGSLLGNVKETAADDRRWYWIEKRSHFYSDARKDAKLWTDDSPNDILEVLIW
jgi:spermidine synthase